VQADPLRRYNLFSHHFVFSVKISIDSA
jgi:hypothetical protein